MFHYLPITLLVLIASLQFVLAHTKDLSPWKGGGFGMFSTVDSPGARKLRVYLVGEDQKKIEVRRRLYRHVEKAFRTMPTKPRFDQAVQSIRHLVKSSKKEDISNEFLVVQFWRYKYSSQTGWIEKKLVFPAKVRVNE